MSERAKPKSGKESGPRSAEGTLWTAHVVPGALDLRVEAAKLAEVMDAARRAVEDAEDRIEESVKPFTVAVSPDTLSLPVG